MNKIVFYNVHQNGDMALNRGIVAWIANNLPSHYEIEYQTAKNTNAVSFHDRVKVTPVGSPVDNDNSVMVNLWIATSPSFVASGNPINYINKSSYYHCCEVVDYLNKAYGLSIPLPQSEVDVLPRSNANPKQKHNADTLLSKLSQYDKKVLVCNGDTHSQQSPNFSLSDYIKSLVQNKPNVAFIYTADFLNPLSNEFFVNDYCSIPNLNEIDYLSTFCDVLVTRRSGPGEIIQTYENFFDEKKAIVSLFAHNYAQFIFTEGTAKLEWTNNYAPEAICRLIEKHL